MHCNKCGNEDEGKNKFCAYCGNDLSKTLLDSSEQASSICSDKNIRKKANVGTWVFGIISVVLAVMLTLSMLGVFNAADDSSFVSKNFSTPEDAIEYFVDCIKEADIKGALKACAIDEIAQGYDYENFALRIRLMMPIVQTLLPSEYDMYVTYNQYITAQQITMQTIHFMNGFDFPEEYYDLIEGESIQKPDRDMIKQVIKALEPDLSGLEIIEIEKHSMHGLSINKENQKMRAKIYSADDVQSRTVLYEYDGEYYIGGFKLIENDGKWLIMGINDDLSNGSPFGTPYKVSSESEFWDMIDGN